MKILNLRFKNLNSLVGEWSIDFTTPEYVSSGIFAITGPTGAGKSTILDAICLALYGRTPRLKSISKSGNEIMSRQTGECFSEVTFATRAGEFRCHWSQHRARKKANANLIDSKHELSNAINGNILETKKRDVATAVEEKTGMDFDRFTRSMLLAQGGFAAFLQALPDDRAPILEQITGTEIDSEISKRILACDLYAPAGTSHTEKIWLWTSSMNQEGKIAVESTVSSSRVFLLASSLLHPSSFLSSSCFFCRSLSSSSSLFFLTSFHYLFLSVNYL